MTASTKMTVHTQAVERFEAMDYREKLLLVQEFSREYPTLKASALNLVEYLKLRDEE